MDVAVPVPTVRKPVKEVLTIPDGVEHDEWIQTAETTEERAERARAVALAKQCRHVIFQGLEQMTTGNARRDTEWEQQRSKLCVFRPSALMTPKKDQEKESTSPQVLQKTDTSD
eukprot:symbB.v1.2.017535.t1/scaffold1371.1/size209032/7